jgi:signal transduction histidine kinase
MKIKLGNETTKSKLSIKQKLLIITFLIIGSNLLIGFAIYKSNQKQLDSSRWVEHSEKIINESNLLLAIGLEIEASARGFAISNDSSFLSQYYYTKSYYHNINKLNKLAKDNNSQLNLDSIKYYLYKYVDFSNNLIEIRSTQGLSQAMELVSTKVGKNYFDKLTKYIGLFQFEESKLLKERKNRNQKSLNTFNNLTMAMFGLMGILTVLLIAVTGNNFVQRKDKEINTEKLVFVTNELNYQSEEKIKLEAANKELESFSYSISHDLRAPLRHISGFVELLKKSNSTQLNESGIRYLKIISESATEMGNLIDAILAFSRLSRSELQITKINTNNLVKKVMNDFEVDMKGRQIEIIIPHLSDVMGDENLIHQVWVNLISNAIKYSKNVEKAVIEIGSYAEKNVIVFFVKDNGAGFDMQYATKLFGVFQRLHKAKEFEGIGIGLANVHRIISRHNGKCWAESEINKGAKFYFSLPIVT